MNVTKSRILAALGALVVSAATLTLANPAQAEIRDLTTVTVGNGARGVVVSPDSSTVYVTNGDADSVVVIDAATNAVVTTITDAAIDEPLGIAISADGSKVYVGNQGVGQTAVIDTASNQVTDTLPFTGLFIALTPDGDRLLMSGLSDEVQVVSTETGALLETVTLVFATQGVAVLPDGSAAYVAISGGAQDAVAAIDMSDYSSSIISDSSFADPVELAASPDGQRVYVANQTATDISVIDTESNMVVNELNVGNGPFATTVSPNSQVLFTTVTGQDPQDPEFATATNVMDGSQLATLSVGSLPGAIAVSPNGKRGYIANFESPTVNVFDARQDQTVAGRCAKPPKALPRIGKKTLVKKNCLTNAGRQVKVDVSAKIRNRGDVRTFRLIRGKGGKVKIQTFGYPLKLKVTWKAKASNGFTKFEQKAKYRT